MTTNIHKVADRQSLEELKQAMGSLQLDSTSIVGGSTSHFRIQGGTPEQIAQIKEAMQKVLEGKGLTISDSKIRDGIHGSPTPGDENKPGFHTITFNVPENQGRLLDKTTEEVRGALGLSSKANFDHPDRSPTDNVLKQAHHRSNSGPSMT
ncbi:MAG: hypothetical protein HY053_06600 [Proteobacteria bacterium]|nr:hypothetical protein [Pseudomonadota bacterium]